MSWNPFAKTQAPEPYLVDDNYLGFSNDGCLNPQLPTILSWTEQDEIYTHVAALRQSLRDHFPELDGKHVHFLVVVDTPCGDQTVRSDDSLLILDSATPWTMCGQAVYLEGGRPVDASKCPPPSILRPAFGATT